MRDYDLASLSPEQLRTLKQAEEELGVVLLAYEPDLEEGNDSLNPRTPKGTEQPR